MNLLLHKLSEQRYRSIVSDPPQCVLLIAPKGSGKGTILTNLANDIAGDNNSGRVINIDPLNNKQLISIQQVRELKNMLRLSSNLKRIIIIKNAGLVSIEAQNSILKLIEEPPKNTIFLIGIDTIGEVIETIISRSSIWRLVPPTKGQILEYFKNYSLPSKEKAITIAGSRVGLIVELINENKDHPLLQSIQTSKEILIENSYQRLLRVDSLSKDINQTMILFDALELVCEAALENSARKENKTVKSWAKRTELIINAQNAIKLNIQPKAVLCHLFMVL